MISDPQGRLIVDFVGQFEHLESDFSQVCRRIGIEFRMVHNNRSDHEPFQRYYNVQTRKLVADYFAREIEYFDFKSDDFVDVRHNRAA